MKYAKTYSNAVVEYGRYSEIEVEYIEKGFSEVILWSMSETVDIFNSKLRKLYMYITSVTCDANSWVTRYIHDDNTDLPCIIVSVNINDYENIKLLFIDTTQSI